jgi:4-hydroxyphenylpyruvate dioxygenase-like putative hemolysin
MQTRMNQAIIMDREYKREVFLQIFSQKYMKKKRSEKPVRRKVSEREDSLMLAIP